jgi:DNA-binding CsgD family transcriptional regulator
VFVITADQVDSRHRPDLVDVTLEGLNLRYGSALMLPFEQNSGDEIQGLTAHAGATLDIVFELTRASQWSVGCGIGPVDEPLPKTVRAARGPAFVAARQAVTRAKQSAHRFALRSSGPAAADPGPLVALAIALRARRTLEGWEVYDLLRSGLTQREIAQRLGVSPQAVSQRIWAANIRTELDARADLEAVLALANEAAS